MENQSESSTQYSSQAGYFLEVLRYVGTGVLAIIGLVVAVFGLKDMIWFVSDVVWRLSKGYFRWDMELAMLGYLVATILFASLCFLLANALYRLQWSRRIGTWIAAMAIGSFLGIAIFVLMLGSGFSAID